MPAASTTVALVLAPRFPLLSFSTCSESMRVANRELGRIAFNRLILTCSDEPATSSSGITITPDARLDDAIIAPVILVLSSYKPEEACTPPFLAWLRKQYRQGAVIGCVDTAAYILAKARILGRHKVAVHRESLAIYRELLEGSVLLDRIHSSDGRIVSSAGGMATLDMMLGLIRRFHDAALADRVAHVLNYHPLANDADAAEVAPDGVIARIDRRLARMVELMQTNLHNPLSVSVICRRAGVPAATASRLFTRYFDSSPSRYYVRLRMERAESLLESSPLSIGDIAAKVGFTDASAFTRAYRRQFHKRPSESRKGGLERIVHF